MVSDKQSLLKYRPEIDGLRAIAVIAVIFFHAGFDVFKGGYVGVDVFFVISGFLITRILLHEIQDASFSFKSFYLRRAKRILPALYLVIVVSIPFAWFLLLPDQMIAFAKSVAAISVFASNIFFWKTSSYFNPNSELIPLLHTWSLAIEEQFYLLYPACLFFCWSFGLRRLFLINLVICLLSIILSQTGWQYYSYANFYLIPSRAWELLLGCLLAFTYLDQLPNTQFSLTVSNAFSMIGFLLISYAVFFFSKTTANPSLYTLIPTLGAVLIIAFAHRKTLVGKILATKLLVGIGLISYSAYLWHQPVFAFARIFKEGNLSRFEYLLLIAATFSLAFCSWLWVEQPFRKKQLPTFLLKPTFFAISGSALLMLAVLAYQLQGFPGRFQVPLYVNNSFSLPERARCHDIDYAHQSKDWFCYIDEDGKKKGLDFVLLGDSHALQMLPAFEEAAKKTKKNGIITGFSGCAPLLGTTPILREDQQTRNCELLNQRVFDYVVREKIKYIFLVARWTYYTDGGYTAEDRFINFIGFNKNTKPSLVNTRTAFKQGLENTIRQYAAKGVQVYIVNQVPMQLEEPQSVYYKAYAHTWNVNKYLDASSVSLAAFLKLRSFVDSVFAEHQKDKRLSIFNLEQVLCDEKKCPIGTKDASYYQDTNHLSKVGALRLAPSFEKILEKI